MKIGVIGCGYVFDLYMSTIGRHPGIEIAGIFDIDQERATRVAAFYGLESYPSREAILADDTVLIIANFTSIEAHYEVTRAALLAGKHVYSEKPFVTDMEEARELVALAESLGLRISCAPSNALSATSQTMWKAVQDNAIGDVRLVYAEFDNQPVYLMNPESWRSRSGTPWPYLHEYESGCTWEHVGYHLTWMCAIFGPVRQVTAFSKMTLPDKTNLPMDPADTPDFSVACLDFESGVVGRITCSIAVPYDHEMRIIGNRGIIHTNTYREYECPVYLERFGKLNLDARRVRIVRTNSFLQWLFGIGGRKIPLIRTPPPGSNSLPKKKRSPKAAFQRFWRNQIGQQDKAMGLAELVDALVTGRPHFPTHDFTLHVTELTLAIQGAGPDGNCHRLRTRFEPVDLPERSREVAPDYRDYAAHSFRERRWMRLREAFRKGPPPSPSGR
jgi:predicted dehydrogenase